MDEQAFTTTPSQDFHLEQLRRSAPKMSREQLIQMLLEATHLCIIRQNVITALIRQGGIDRNGRH